ncbi:hypothetical protein KFK09_010222 [Dendrobium nobile]|uniref:Uncharacterized protein n=1 Tax=Dendrobium nobile TaxID=94219 RepID=A0A8T3BJ57_DENNO|nr:hypothetical protein KFK09_010222 [Dendrobium nobile]
MGRMVSGQTEGAAFAISSFLGCFQLTIEMLCCLPYLINCLNHEELYNSQEMNREKKKGKYKCIGKVDFCSKKQYKAQPPKLNRKFNIYALWTCRNDLYLRVKLSKEL